MQPRIYILLFLIILAACSQPETKKTGNPKQPNDNPTETKLYWHWQDDFTPSEKSKIKKYISTVTTATFKVLGKYPFEVHYYFKRSDDKNEPIPWAHTIRNKKTQGVRFYINPDFDYEVLMADWTAPHEISHLSIPPVGRENSWFAEGYASYMQYQIMQELGVYTKEEVIQKYQFKIDFIRLEYSDEMTFIENAKLLRAQYNFPALYWGGAKYFIHIDQLLSTQDSISLNDLIKKYQLCCRNKDATIEMLLNSLDKDLKTPLFNDLFEKCNTKSFGEIYYE